MNSITITEEDDPRLVNGDLEAAEMYCRLAADMVRRLYNDPDECEVAAADALIERALVILRKLMDEEHKRKQAA